MCVPCLTLVAAGQDDFGTVFKLSPGNKQWKRKFFNHRSMFIHNSSPNPETGSHDSAPRVALAAVLSGGCRSEVADREWALAAIVHQQGIPMVGC